jgi:hypothetical protein
MRSMWGYKSQAECGGATGPQASLLCISVASTRTGSEMPGALGPFATLQARMPAVQSEFMEYSRAVCELILYSFPR